MDMLKELQTLLSVINILALWVIGIYTWQSNRKRVTNERLAGLEEDFDSKIEQVKDSIGRQGSRLTAMEKDLQHAPTHEDLKRLHSRIDDVAGGIEGLKGEFRGTNHTLNLIHAYLLNGGKQ